MINGSSCMDVLNAKRSLGFAVLNDILVISLSRSYIVFIYSRSSSLVITESLSSVIASSLASISSLWIRGCSIIFLSILAPMAVLVLSSTQSSEPLFCLSLSVSVSSRFLLDELSMIMKSSMEYISILLI